jgi:carbonic anhydrase
MSLIDEALSANATIANDYDPSRGKPPAPKIAIVTCADPRLTDIEQMLGLAHADVDMIRNFGTVIDDDAVRSLVLSTRLLGTREIMIINHTDCGMLRFTDSELEDRLRKETGRAPIAPARFYSFTDAEVNTKEQIQKARSHPWISPEVPVRGFVYDVSTRAAQRSVRRPGDRHRLVRAVDRDPAVSGLATAWYRAANWTRSVIPTAGL